MICTDKQRGCISGLSQRKVEALGNPPVHVTLFWSIYKQEREGNGGKSRGKRFWEWGLGSKRDQAKRRGGDERQRGLEGVNSVSPRLTSPRWWELTLQGSPPTPQLQATLPAWVKWQIFQRWEVPIIIEWAQEGMDGWFYFSTRVRGRCPVLLLSPQFLPCSWRAGLTLANLHCCLLPDLRRGTKISHFPHCH